MTSNISNVPVEETRENRLSSESGSRQPIVLFIGNQPETILPLNEVLPDSNFTAITVPDEYSALKIAAVIPPQLVVADVRTPGVKWLALAMALKHAVPDCKVLLIHEPPWPVGLAASPNLAARNFVTIV
jgi:response regulator RpfG family c-di-GMP phosphodiesterase